ADLPISRLADMFGSAGASPSLSEQPSPSVDRGMGVRYAFIGV
ncbi:MAG: hypothetical protein SLRJCFUN_000490, partial [Candidatus Fervidibacter sp.]